MSIPLVSVLITTRNRPVELNESLQKIFDQTYSEFEVLIVDDASTTNDINDIVKKFTSIRVIKHKESSGYLVSRNELMRLASGKYFLHLDDDAHLVQPDAIEKAVRIMESDEGIGVFAFTVHEDVNPPPQEILNVPSKVIDVRSFTGCGHIIRRSVFEELGPLKEAFVFYCEEIDFCLRAWEAGYRVVRDPSLIVHHRVDWRLRDNIRREDENSNPGYYGKDWRVELGVRNELWWVLQLVPAPYVFGLLPYKAFKFYQFHKKNGYARSVRKGLFDFVRLMPAILKERRPVRRTTFKKWLQLK